MDKYRLDNLNVTQYHNYPWVKDGKVINNFKKTGIDTYFGFVAKCLSGSWFGSEFWQSLRESKQNDPERYKQMKSFLPGYTLCAEYSGRRKEEVFTAYNDLICIDIDPGHNKEITDWVLIRDKFFEAWPEVVLSSLSASGKGVFMVFALKDQKADSYNTHEKNHKLYFEGLERAFKHYNILLDTSCKDVPRLRYATYDPDLKYRAILQKEFALPPQPQKKATEPRKYKSNIKGAYDPFAHAVNAANKRWGEFGEGNKHNWINTATFTLKLNGVPAHERENFINNNYLDKRDINTNCIQ